MKKDNRDTSQQKGKRPFFARLLEAQELEQVAGGGLPQTGKYASDFPDVTRKAPSDRDEIFVTLKYPSDNDEITY